MTDFDDRRNDLQKQRANAAAARAAADAARERLARLQAQQRTLDRTGQGQQLAQQIAKATADFQTAKTHAADAAKLEAGAIAGFAQIAPDPRDAIARLSDRFPILMMPVRLETRFKGSQLWVRVYPDTCSIDTFEERLSEAEISAAKLYWQSMWEAGGIPDQERGAWRGLAGTRGSGRAEWIITNYKPLNTKPSKAKADDVVLTIATKAPPTDDEQKALAAYWSSFDQAAYDTLVAALQGDSARAAQLVQDFVPVNLAAKMQNVAVQTAFVIFPNNDTLDLKRQSWSQPATAALMPDRFVFLGYRNDVHEVVALGKPLPASLPVAPDPAAPESEQLRQDPNTGELIIPSELQWLADFDKAVDAGMGFRIDLTPAQQTGGFDRVLVLGIRLSADATAAQHELETLFTHHRFGRSGFAIVPQGTPTNNTESDSSGYSRVEDPDVSFDELAKDALFTETADPPDKADGQCLAEALGIDSAVLKKVRNSDGRDQADAHAMNVALFPATLGYWMETMMGPVFTDAAVQKTRDFFNRYVSGRGAVPAVRVGRQPYGILPATAYSRMQWFGPGPNITGAAADPFLPRLYAILTAMEADWETMSKDVSFAGKKGDPHQLLLDIVGLHSGSVEYAQRVAESAQQLYNRLALDGLGALLGALVLAGLFQSGRDLLKRFGYSGREDPDILKKFFLGEHNPMKGPVIDDVPLSESDPIRPSTADGKQNYLQWLIAAANKSLDTVYAQQGFRGDTPPRALLYLMLRHALQLGYHDTSLRLHQQFGLLTADAVRAAKLDDPFIHIRQTAQPFESRYEVLYKTEKVITGSPTQSIGDYIAKSWGTLTVARSLREQLGALERLKDASTARLERAFSEHIDCCTYRLDAWLLGLVHAQLDRMRKESVKGLYLGAYAWLENLRPDARVLEPVQIADPAVAQDFAEPNAPPLLRDSQNEGFIHAPSLNHAVAAAVLRNGYIANAGKPNAQTLAVNVTSERVRIALGMLEGIRGGQSLGALLGYQFERALHDAHDDFGHELDSFIFKLRREFPLAANRLASTHLDGDDVAIEAIEARNVLDGVALLNYIRNAPAANKTYKFGISRLPDATPAQAAAINAEAGRLAEIYDAVADLAMAEGVYEAVLGNYDRVASTLDAYSKGNFPPEPLVARTPFDGIGLTHKVGLQFALGSSAVDPSSTPRSLGEPAVNAWLATILPPLSDVGCVVHFRDSNGNAAQQEVRLGDLGVQPLDVLQLLRGDQHQQSLTELDERITRALGGAARPDGTIEIRYLEKIAAPFSIFEVLPLARRLARLLAAARPLKATDLSLANEAKRSDDAGAFVDPQRIQNVLAMLTALRADLDAFAGQLDPLVSDPVAHRTDILANADDWIDTTASLLARAAAFAMPQSGWAFAYDYRARAFSGVLKKASDLTLRWATRLTDFDTVIAQYDALPGTATDDDRLQLLTRAERLVSAQTISPFPATLADYRAQLDMERATFAAKRADFLDIVNTTRTRVSLLLADVAARLPVDAFELPALSVAEEETLMISFAQDALSTIRLVVRECDRRIKAANDAQAPDAAAKALLGPDFVIVPEFTLPAAQAEELSQAVAASGSLLDYLTTTLDTPLPVDTWMYGVARVRERIRDWEQIVMLCGSLGANEPELTPLQLPFVAGDRWLALEFPPDTKLDREHLLYTAHFAAPFDKTARQCGLLLDEWNEIIPSASTTSGLTFHYDRPNNEAPQTMLLVTPTTFRGAWQWNDLVDALNETLKLAKRRAVEPVHVDRTPYAQFLPATVMAMTVRQLTIAANLAINNNLYAQVPHE